MSASEMKLTPQQALEQLKAGNSRFSAGQMEYPRLGRPRREEVTREGQHPIATVVSCSDSRVPVEHIFDQGIGDLFIIRVAGNVCANDETGSVEYGVLHAGTPLCVILGHTHCGAVTAVASGAEAGGCIPKLVEPIKRPVEKAKAELPGAGLDTVVAQAVRHNVTQAIDDLLTGSPDLRSAVESGDLLVKGAVYDIQSGVVEWM